MPGWFVCLPWFYLKRPQTGHTLFEALLYLRQLSSVSSPFAIYDCPISVCHRTAVSISSIYPFSTCTQPRGIVKQIIVLILASFQVPIISDPVLTFTVQFGSQVMLIKLDMPSGVGFRLVGTFKAEHTTVSFGCEAICHIWWHFGHDFVQPGLDS